MKKRPMPYISSTGELVIPLDAPVRFHWWDGGQGIAETLRDLNVDPETWSRHTSAPYPARMQRRSPRTPAPHRITASDCIPAPETLESLFAFDSVRADIGFVGL